MITNEQITAALRKLGPSAPAVIADQLQSNPGAVGYHLRRMLKEKMLIVAGRSNDRVYALPDQKLEGAPPKKQKPKKGGHGKKTKRAAPAPRTAERFIPAVDADLQLHIINGGAPLSFDATQTEAIASLLFQHYKA